MDVILVPGNSVDAMPTTKPKTVWTGYQTTWRSPAYVDHSEPIEGPVRLKITQPYPNWPSPNGTTKPAPASRRHIDSAGQTDARWLNLDCYALKPPAAFTTGRSFWTVKPGPPSQAERLAQLNLRDSDSSQANRQQDQ